MVRTEHEKGEEEGVAMLPMDGAPSSSSSEATATPAGAPAKGDASPAAAAADDAVDEYGGDATAAAAASKDGGAGAGEGDAKEEDESKPTCKEKLQAEWEALRDGLGKWVCLQYDADGEDGDAGDSGLAPADAGVVAPEESGDGGAAENDDDDGGDDDDDDDETCVEQIYGVYHAVCQEVYGFVESGGFQKGIAVTIVLAAFLAGAATYFEEDPLWITILNYVVSWIFVAEMVLKIVGNQPWHGRYFIDAWNVFDFLIVLASFSPDGGAIDFAYKLIGFVSADKTVSKNIKLLRILRLFKLVRNIKGLKVIIVSLVKALEFGKYIALLTVMTMYLFAVIGMMFFAKNDPIMFGTLHNTMITLWQAVSGDDWTEIMYTQSEGCDYANADGHYRVGGTDGHGAGRCMDPEKTNFVLVTAYFMTVVILLSMMFVNLFVGAILMAVEETRLEVGNEQNLHVHMISAHDVEIADWSLIGEGRSDPYCLIEIAPEWPPLSHDDALCLGHFGVGADYGPKLCGEGCAPEACEKRCGKSCATKRMWVADKHVSSCFRAAPSKDSYRNTKVKKQTLQPVWDEHFDFFPLDKLGSHMLHIQVWDWDMCGGDDPLGDLNIDLSKMDFGTTYELCLPLQHTSTGHVKLSLRKDKSGSSSGTRWDSIVETLNDMAVDAEELHEIMPDMVKERAEETLALTRKMVRRKSSYNKRANHKHWRNALNRMHGGNTARLKKAASTFESNMSGIKRRFSMSPGSSPNGRDGFTSSALLDAASAIAQVAEENAAAAKASGQVDDASSQWVPNHE